MSVGVNIIFVCILLFNYQSIAKQSLQNRVQMEYSLHNDITNKQLFYGKWRIVDSIIPSSGILPRSYSRFDENGGFVGWNTDYINSIIGEEIIFNEDYAEYAEEKHEYVYKPETYTHALLTDEQQIARYSVEELGLSSKYFSIVYFLLPDNCQVAGYENHVDKVTIADIYLLLLKDNETIYASNGVIMYQLERMG